MYEFEEEVQEKKRLARNNRYKTGQGNRRSRAFKRPELTEREIEERHGKVMEYKVGQPITWAEFRQYPKEMQQEWVNVFAKKFDCGGKGIALATGTSQSSIACYFKANDLSLPENTGTYSERKGDAIRAWIAEATPTPPAPEPTPEKPKKSEPKKPEPNYFVNTIQHGTMQLTGNATEIFQTLFGIFRDARLVLDIVFDVMPAQEPPAVAEPEPEPESVEPEPTAQTVTEQRKVNLNTCVFNDLRKIGVSPNIAANIIQSRPFTSVDDLSRVAGLNKCFFNILREKVTVFDEV